MKKTYIAPNTAFEAIEISNIICTSLTSAGNAVENHITSADAKRRQEIEDEEIMESVEYGSIW